MMELQFPYFQILLIISVLFLYMVVKLVHPLRNRSSSVTKIPPGPRGMPIIGNLHQLGGSPHQALAVLAKEHGPIMRLHLGQLKTTVISSPDLAKEVFTTHDVIFANRPNTVANKILSYNFLDIGFAPYGGYWRQLRKICKLDLLSPSRVQSFRSIMEEEVKNLINEAVGCAGTGSPVDLSKMLYSMTHSISLSAAFGRTCEYKEAYLSAAYKIIKKAKGFTLVNLFPSFKLLPVITGVKTKFQKLHREKDQVVQKILDEHKKKNKENVRQESEEEEEEDLMDVLLKLQQQGDLEFPLIDDSIKAVLWDMVTAGGETSAATMEWAMTEMMKNPDVMRKAVDEVRRVFSEKGDINESSVNELQYLKAVIKETLRLHPPSPLLMPREGIESCEVSGYEIPANSRVIVNAWSIGRDPAVWPEPERFWPERFLNNSIDFKGKNFEYIPFGAGRRMCPGIVFAQASIELALAQLLFHFDWKLPEGMKKEDIDMSETFGLAVSRRVGLTLIPVPRQLISVK